jgi:ABC-type transport system involved in Fe-S cluster assembly fused permease/ATPase subunit
MTRIGRRSLIEVALYAGLIFAKSNACVGWLQEWLWQPVEFYAYDALNTAAQSHVMSLSSDFHASKEANDIFMDVYRGKNIIPLVDTVCFKVIPMFIDLTLVFAYLYYLFGPYMALNLGVTTLVYLYTTSKLATMVDDRRRGYIVHHRREWKAQQSTISKWQLASVRPSMHILSISG